MIGSRRRRQARLSLGTPGHSGSAPKYPISGLHGEERHCPCLQKSYYSLVTTKDLRQPSSCPVAP